MTRRDKFGFCMSIIANTTKRLNEEQIAVLGLRQDPTSPFKELYLGEGDFAWRGTVSGGPLIHTPLKVDPVEIRENAVRVLTELFNDVLVEPPVVTPPKKTRRTKK